VEDGHSYYRTKGGSVIKVENSGQEGIMTLSGGLQIEDNQPITVQTIYDQTGTADGNGERTGNGKSYVVEQSLPLGSKRSLYSILNGRTDCSRFFDLMTKGGAVNTLLKAKLSGYTCADYNCSLFDAYNYTVYVPTDETIDQLHNDGYLPYWDDYDALAAEQFGGDASKLKEARKLVAERILNFMKYHIQDNAVFIGGEGADEVKYESSTLNPKNKRFYSLLITADDTSLTIKDLLGNQRSVVTTGTNYNMMGREYWIQSADKPNMTSLYNASDVVVHQIDGVLLYDATQLTKWQDEINALNDEP